MELIFFLMNAKYFALITLNLQLQFLAKASFSLLLILLVCNDDQYWCLFAQEDSSRPQTARTEVPEDEEAGDIPGQVDVEGEADDEEAAEEDQENDEDNDDNAEEEEEAEEDVDMD